MAVDALAKVEKAYSEEFLLSKARDGITDRMAEHMATVRHGQNLRKAQALELLARKELDIG